MVYSGRLTPACLLEIGYAKFQKCYFQFLATVGLVLHMKAESCMHTENQLHEVS